MPRSPQKRVTVILRRPPTHPQTAHGLRAALGYTTVGLQVRIILLGAAQGLREAHAQLSPPIQRALATLATLGCPIMACSDSAELAELAAQSDAVVCW